MTDEDAGMLESLAWSGQVGYNDPSNDNMWVPQDVSGLYTISVTVSGTFGTGKFNLTNPFTQPKGGNLQQIIACANTFANNYSIAAAFGAQNTFIGNALGGNSPVLEDWD
jgi:hypothetical protein